MRVPQFPEKERLQSLTQSASSARVSILSCIHLLQVNNELKAAIATFQPVTNREGEVAVAHNTRKTHQWGYLRVKPQ